MYDRPFIKQLENGKYSVHTTSDSKWYWGDDFYEAAVMCRKIENVQEALLEVENFLRKVLWKV